MLQPTSMSWQVRSVEWVRHDVPFGNWLVDESRAHLLHPERPEEGRATAEEPAGGRADAPPNQLSSPRPRGSGCLAAADHAGLPAPAARRRDLEADRPAGRRRPAGAGDDLPPRDSTIRRSSPTSPGSTIRAPRSATIRAATSRRTPPSAGRRWSRTISAGGCLRPSTAASPTQTAITARPTTAARTSR